MAARKTPDKQQAKASKLSEKQATFVREYLIDLNATQAAIRAGYSAKTAAEQAYDLLRRPHIEAAVAQARQKREQRVEATGARVIEELGYIALSDIGEVLASEDLGNGRVLITVRSLDDLKPSARRCIKSIKQTTTEHTEGRGEEARVVEKVVLQVELHPKVAALELLMAHHGLNAPQKVDVSGTVQMVSAKETLGAKLDGLRQRTAQPGRDAGSGPEGAG